MNMFLVGARPMWIYGADADIDGREQENSDIEYIGLYQFNVVTSYLWLRDGMNRQYNFSPNISVLNSNHFTY